jgi:hypothetical protein
MKTDIAATPSATPNTDWFDVVEMLNPPPVDWYETSQAFLLTRSISVKQARFVPERTHHVSPSAGGFYYFLDQRIGLNPWRIFIIRRKSMLDLGLEQTLRYLQRSYTAVDGLWFMKTEDAHGFESALDIDEAVWKVMPKIQARALKAFCGKTAGLDSLIDCFETKLFLDGFEFRTERSTDMAEITFLKCPWYEKLVKSNRTHLAEKIGARICTAEFSGWAAEFGCGFSFSGENRICRGCEKCGVRFSGETAKAD